MINSTMFGASHRITSLEESIQRIGLGPLRALILATQVFDLFFQKPGFKSKLQKIWTHSSSVANRARQIAQDRAWPAEAVEESFFAGLLHDVGRVVMVACPEVERKALFPEYDLAHDDRSLSLRFRTPSTRRPARTRCPFGAFPTQLSTRSAPSVSPA